MNEDWVSQMFEATNPYTQHLLPTNIESVERLVLEHTWTMGDYEELMSYFEDQENKTAYRRMIAVNRMIVSLLKTGKTNEF